MNTPATRPGFIILTYVSPIAALSSFAALLWAAVRDGRAERAVRSR